MAAAAGCTRSSTWSPELAPGLSERQRSALANRRVLLDDYLPHRAYAASMPASREALSAIAALPFIRGIRGFRAADKIAPSLRIAGQTAPGPDADGRQVVAVELFADVGPASLTPLFAAIDAETVLVEDKTHYIKLPRFDDIAAVAAHDGVKWIDDAFDAVEPHDDLSLAATTTDRVNRVHGFTGLGMTIGLSEADLIDPALHADLAGRVTFGNNPTANPDPIEQNHALGVGGIMIGDGSGDPTKIGFLPDAELVNYAVGRALQTHKRRAYGIPKEARDDHGAVLMNNSWGSINCNKVGKYHWIGHWFDKAIHDEGIPIVRSIGNTSGDNGDLAEEGCRPLTFESLHHGIPKNDIAVGNWDLDINEREERSAIGPTRDDRLKPDLVAPGNGFSTLSLGGGYGPTRGTSSAAPVVSGIYGQVLEALETVAGIPALDVRPATVKALLIHSAKDVGPPGPDYFHGWGLVQAAPAVRLAKEHARYVFEDTLSPNDLPDEHWVTIGAQRFGFKATLVWDDDPASVLASHTLKNNLDLVVVDPNGVEYYPYDTLLLSQSAGDREVEAMAGARVCATAGCDDRNTVEQVVVASNGLPLTPGNWTVEVRDGGLANSQDYSVVVTPDCPVRIYGDAQMTGLLHCPDFEPLEPEVVSIEADNVTLDCRDNQILGAGYDVDGLRGEYAGIRATRNGLEITDCIVNDADVGIDLAGVTGALLTDVTVEYVGQAGIRADGTNNTITRAVIQGVHGNLAGAIDLSGSGHRVIDGFVSPILDVGGIFHGVKTQGARFVGQDPTDSIHIDGLVIQNATDGISATGQAASVVVENSPISSPTQNGIVVSGEVTDFELARNRIEGFGKDHAGILVSDVPRQQASVIREVSSNEITGNDQANQRGIWIDKSTDCTVAANLTITRVGTGISEVDSDCAIASNVITANDVGIASTRSVLAITDNDIGTSTVGISVVEPDGGSISGNDDIEDAISGISVGDANWLPVHISSNIVRLPVGGIGITVGDSRRVSVSLNKVNWEGVAPAATGISVADSQSTSVSGNTVGNMQRCVVVERSKDSSISGNDLRACTVEAIGATDDVDGSFEGNEIADAADVGIGYYSGAGGSIRRNVFSFTAGSGAHAILLGKDLASSDAVAGLTISEPEIHGFHNGITFRHGVTSATIVDSVISATTTALNGIVSTPGAQLTIERNELSGGAMDARFRDPVDTRYNLWSEIGALDIYDVDNDGYGECGGDWAFASANYSGTVAGGVTRSTKTQEVSDIAPQTTRTGSCP